MSFDIIFQRFEGGNATAGDAEPLRLLLEPTIHETDGSWARIHTEDGEADIYGMDNLGSGFMVSRAAGRAVWDIMFEIAHVGRFAVMLLDCGTCITEASDKADLPVGMPQPLTVVRSGQELLQIIESC